MRSLVAIPRVAIAAATVNPFDYCRERAAPPASSLHYALVFLDRPRRRAIEALVALDLELAKASRDTSDAGVAAAQLAWWHAELRHLDAGMPQHPVTQALQQTAAVSGTTAASLAPLLAAAEADLAHPRHATFASLDAHCATTGGELAVLAVRAAAGARRGEDVPEQHARRLGAVLRLGEVLRDVGRDARRNRIYLPQEDLARYGVTAAEVLQRRPGAGFVPLMQFQAARLAQLRREAVEGATALGREARRALRPALILGRLQEALFRELERDRFPVLDQRVSLTPIRKLWIAARTK